MRPAESEPRERVARVELDGPLKQAAVLRLGGQAGRRRSRRSRRRRRSWARAPSHGFSCANASSCAAEPRQRVAEPDARLGEFRIGGDGAARVALGAFELRAVGLEREPHRVHGREPGERRSVVRVGADRLLEQCARLIERSLLEPVEEAPASRMPFEDVDARSDAGRGREILPGAGAPPRPRRPGPACRTSRRDRRRSSRRPRSRPSFRRRAVTSRAGAGPRAGRRR